MKIILLILFVASVSAQNEDSLVCVERGHIWSQAISTTLMYCPDRIVDLPDKTIRIGWDNNIVTKICKRCGLTIKVPIQAEPDTVVIWRRK